MSLYRIYEMLVEAEYKKGSCEEGLKSKDFYKYHQEEGHMINRYKDLHNEVIHMLLGREVSMVDEPSKNNEVYRV